MNNLEKSKFKRFIAFVLAVVLVTASSAPANAAITIYDADTNLLLTGPNITLVILSGSKANELIVNPTSFTVTVAVNEGFRVRSTDKKALNNNGGLATECVSSYSELFIQAGPDVSKTVTVTPSTSACTLAGVSRSVVAPAPAPVTAPPVEVVPPPTPPPTPVTPVGPPKATPPPGLELATLIKLVCPSGAVDVNHPCKAVYYYGSDGKRRPFPNEKVYFTWYADFSAVKEVSAEVLAKAPLAAPVTYRPGARMVKFQTVNNVYAVTRDGTLRWIKTEALAAALYGVDWNKKIDDVSDAFYVNYKFGDDIESVSDYSPEAERTATKTVDNNLGYFD